MNRRSFLRFSAIGTGALAIAGLGRAEQVGLLGSADAYEAWTDVARERGSRAIVAAGVLAANPHNSRPWRFQVDTARIRVYLDLARSLGPVGPVLRQMHLDIGCAVENLILAASAQGLAATPAMFPDPHDAAFAVELALIATNAPKSRHAEAIVRRHTNRGPYDPSQHIGTTIEASLRDQVIIRTRRSSSSMPRRQRVARSPTRSFTAPRRSSLTMSSCAQRWTPREVRDHRDGPALDAAGLSSFKRIAAQLAPRPSLDRYHRSRSHQRGVTVPVAFGPERQVVVMMFWCGIPLHAAIPSVRRPLDDVLG